MTAEHPTWSRLRSGAWLRSAPDLPTAHRSNRRRLRVFLGTLVVALAASLSYTWLRPAEYRAAARLEITPAAAPAPSGPAVTPAAESARPFLTEVQILTSRPVLEQVATKLERSGSRVTGFGAEPIAGMQSVLNATPVPSTNVVELAATGPDPEILAPLVNATVDVYRERLAESYRSSSSEAMTLADDEVGRLETKVTTKRHELDAFRIRYNIVSLEREENQVISQVRNNSASLSAAKEKLAIAEGKLSALTESAAAGRPVFRSRDDPGLANLEQRSSQLREELQEMQRHYTQDYLAKEPKAVSLRARLAELEQQIKSQREASQQAALVEAQDEVASAKGAVARIESQIVSGRQEVGQFTSRFNEFKSRQDELTELDTAYKDAVQRRAKLDASERARMPTAKLIEAASVSKEPWRPPYWRDTGIALAGSLLLALLAMWLVEIFNRAEPQPAVVMFQSQPGGVSHDTERPGLSGHGAPMPLEHAAPTLLPQPAMLPRELDADEIAALLRASDGGGRLLLLLLLCGIRPDEAIGLTVGDVDLARGQIRVSGASGRDVALSEAMRALIAPRIEAQGAGRLLDSPGGAMTRDALDAQVLCAAHDAALDDPAAITADCLRHTYVAYLVRQGIRFADLARIVGPMPADLLGAYAALAPAGQRVPRESIDTSLPGTRAGEAG